MWLYFEIPQELAWQTEDQSQLTRVQCPVGVFSSFVRKIVVGLERLRNFTGKRVSRRALPQNCTEVLLSYGLVVGFDVLNCVLNSFDYVCVSVKKIRGELEQFVRETHAYNNGGQGTHFDRRVIESNSKLAAIVGGCPEWERAKTRKIEERRRWTMYARLR